MKKMFHRRKFLSQCGSAAVVLASHGWSAAGRELIGGTPGDQGELAIGEPVNLASYGELQSWLSPSATPFLQTHPITRSSAPLVLAELPWRSGEFDVGVAWPEFRTVDKIALEYTGADKAPQVGGQFVEYWVGITSRQGGWQSLDESEIEGVPIQTDGRTWIFSFSRRRTCRVRVRFENQKQVQISHFAVYGPSRWKGGEVHIEWGHAGPERAYDGRLQRYNGEVVEIRPVGSTELTGKFSWSSSAGGGRIAGIEATVLYAYGMDVDRSILTLRTKACEVSFLPGEVLEEQPIDAPDFGVYIRKSSLAVDLPTYRRQNQGKSRIMDAVSHYPEQSLENAYRHIRARRVTLAFVGVEANNHKFGIAPDGHLVVGSHDPSFGHPMIPQFAVYFATAEQPVLFHIAATQRTGLFESEKPKQQRLEEGWLPIIITTWSENVLAFQRADYGVLQHSREPLDESGLMGNEPALMISRLSIRNNSTIPNLASYYVKPWKPAAGNVGYGPIPTGAQNAWVTSLEANTILVTEGGVKYIACFVNTQGRGALSLEPAFEAVRYSVLLDPGEEHVIYSLIPGEPLPASAEAPEFLALDYQTLHDSTAQYWKTRLAEGMQVEIPDPHLQNIYNASLHHFLLALTKDGKCREYYPNVAMLFYGSIGSESSPVMQVIDMRGMHDRAARCLQAWISTQGDSMPAGDYVSKEGGFFHFWPNYTIDQGMILWTLAEHYLYTRDREWLRKVAPQMVAGCDFIIQARKRTQKLPPGGQRPLSYGLAPAGCVADPRDWEYSFMLNGYFYLGLKKCGQVLQDVDSRNARRIATEAADYLKAIKRALGQSIVRSPVTRLRDNTSVPSVPSYLGLRGFSSDVKDSADPDRRHGYAYDVTIGPFHLLKSEVVEPDGLEVTSMLNYLEDYFFMFTPLPSRVNLEMLAKDWFNLGGFGKLQPYYCHYQEAYLLRDEIPNFLRGFFNTLAAIADPQTLTFQEELDFGGGQPDKTHEEAWFMHQFRYMLLMEIGNDLYLARGTPRRWLEDGKQVAVRHAPSYFGKLSYNIQSAVSRGRIEAVVDLPRRNRPANVYLRLRHPRRATLRTVTVNGRDWKEYESAKEWIKLPVETTELKVTAYYE